MTELMKVTSANNRSEGEDRDNTGTTPVLQTGEAPQRVEDQAVTELRSNLTEREGFEPTVPVRAHRFSRPVPSATRTPLQVRQYKASIRGQPADFQHFCMHCVFDETA